MNIFTQIGFVVLVGLACKNAILIVEVAKVSGMKRGCHRREAALEASRLRLAAHPDDVVRVHLRRRCRWSCDPGPAPRCARRWAWPFSAACSA